jgi:hypothetical protein
MNNDLKIILENWNSFVDLVENETDDRVYLFENDSQTPSESMSFSRLHERMLAGKLTEQKLYETWEASLEYEIGLLEEAGILSRAAGALKKGAQKVTQAGQNGLKRLATFLYSKLIQPLMKMITAATSVAAIKRALDWIRGTMGSGAVNENMISKFMAHPFMKKYGKYIIAGMVLIATAAAVYMGCSEIIELVSSQSVDQIADKTSEIRHVIEAAVQISTDAGCDTCVDAGSKLLAQVTENSSMSDMMEAAAEMSATGKNQMTASLEQAVQMLGDSETVGRGSEEFEQWKQAVNDGKDTLAKFSSDKASYVSKQAGSQTIHLPIGQLAQEAGQAVVKRAANTDF